MDSMLKLNVKHTHTHTHTPLELSSYYLPLSLTLESKF